LQEIKSIAILGAGAMGAAYAAMFEDAGGFDTTLLARGERYERLIQDGLVVNGQTYRPQVIHPDDAWRPVDLVVVALKHHHLEGALPDLKPIVGPDTVIISVMNGLDSEQAIGAAFGMDKMLHCIAVGIDAVREQNRTVYSNPGKLYIGDAVNTPPGAKVERVRQALAQAGIPHEIPDDMIRVMWWKFMINVGMNQSSAVMRAPYGVFQSSPAAQALMRALMQEVIVLAQAGGVNLGEQDIEEWGGFLAKLSPQGKTSMLQDIEAGRKTEVEIFGGKVTALGHALGIATPVNETLLQIIQVLELQGPGSGGPAL